MSDMHTTEVIAAVGQVWRSKGADAVAPRVGPDP
jgi:hypothetical protein